MTHLQAVRDALLASPAVVALVGSRIYPLVAPQDCPRPFVILAVVSAVPFLTHDGVPADLLEDVRVQVRSYGREYDAIHDVARVLDNVVGALQGEPLSGTKDGEQEGYENDTSLYYVSADYFVKRTRG